MNINGVFDINILTIFKTNALMISMYIDISLNVDLVVDRNVNTYANGR